MATHTKTNGTITITGDTGQIVGNVAREALAGPDVAAAVTVNGHEPRRAGRMGLRPLNIHDAGMLAFTCQDPAVIENVGMPRSVTGGHAMESIQACIEADAAGNTRTITRAIDSAGFAGTVNLHELDTFLPTLHFMVHPHFRRQGLGTRGVELMLDWALNRNEGQWLAIRAEVLAANTAAHRLVSNIGFERDYEMDRVADSGRVMLGWILPI